MLPQLQAAGVSVMVVTVASPTKAAEFVAAQEELPMSAVFCSSNLDAYRALLRAVGLWTWSPVAV